MNNSSRSESKKYLLIVVVVLLVALVSFLVWYFFVNKTFKTLSPFSNGPLNKILKAEEIKIENPLTGVMTKELDAVIWKGTRPLGVMVNNYLEARPQSGLVDADVVYEMVAEGGITRFLAFFYTNAPEKVGPIRSTREYYLMIVKEMADAMVMHIGWSPQALTAIETWPVRSLIRLGLNCDNSLPDPKDQPCWRNKARVDGNIPWEHTAYGNLKLLRAKGLEAGWDGENEDFVPWKFKDSAETKNTVSGSASDIQIDFWYEGDYSAAFRYDPTTNTYLRFMGFDAQERLLPHKDAESQKQIQVNNLIVQFASETSIEGDEKNRLDYQLIGSGEAKVFIDGKVIDATWSKVSRDARTVYYDTNGNEMKYNRGNFWICIVPDRNRKQVKYK